MSKTIRPYSEVDEFLGSLLDVYVSSRAYLRVVIDQSSIPGLLASGFAQLNGDVPEFINLTSIPTPSLGATPLVNSKTPILGVTNHWDGISFSQSGGYYPPDNA
jgi:hypothetical protein